MPPLESSISLKLNGNDWFDLGRFQFPGSNKVGNPITIQINAWKTGGTAFDIQICDFTNGGLVIDKKLGFTGIIELYSSSTGET